MKVLYALQANGNGHISRANEILPLLERFCTVDVLLSGVQADVGLNHFVKYRRKGLGFVTAKNDSIDLIKTLQQLKKKKFQEEAKTIPVEEYDFVINDFEPLTAWACKQKDVLCIALSHQFAIIDKAGPKPHHYDPLGWLVLRYFSPVNQGIGFHFKAYDESIFTPVIRKEIRTAYTRNLGHYSVYLPAYSDKKLINILSEHKNTQWHICSKKATKSYAVNNCWIRPANNYDYISSTSTSEGILCAAGFEAPAEAMYMDKKLLVVPVKGQYEQQCNAVALKEIGVPVFKKISRKKYKKLAEWIASKHKVHINYADRTEEVLQKIFVMAIAYKASSEQKSKIAVTTDGSMKELDFVDEYTS